MGFEASLARSLGTWFLWINTIVLVPVLRPGMPWASRPISFPYECNHVARVLGLVMRCLHSNSSPPSPMTAFAISLIENVGLRRGVDVKLSRPRSSEAMYPGVFMSKHANMASCIMLRVVECVALRWGEWSSSSSSSCEM